MSKTLRFATFTTLCAALFGTAATANAALHQGSTTTSASRVLPACSTCWVGTP